MVIRWRPRGEEGQTLVEYALIILLVAVALVLSLTAFGGSLSSVYSQISSRLVGAL